MCQWIPVNVDEISQLSELFFWKHNVVLYRFFSGKAESWCSFALSTLATPISPSADIPSYLILKPTMCDIGCAGFPNGHNPSIALQPCVASPMASKLWLLELKYSYTRRAFF